MANESTSGCAVQPRVGEKADGVKASHGEALGLRSRRPLLTQSRPLRGRLPDVVHQIRVIL
jgi:hypothetical protein